MRPALLALLVAAAPAGALTPAEIVVVANSAVPGSRGVAEHYLAARQVPAENLLVLDLPAADDMTRVDFDGKLAGPVRAFLATRPGVKCVLTVYGVPLRAGGTAAEAESLAAVDSELMLVRFPAVPTAKFVPNPLYWGYPARNRAVTAQAVITARLDGPTPAAARRLVDDAVAVEAAGGLTGRAYIDARGIAFDPKKPGEAGTGYEGYDESFREAATTLVAAGLDVTLDDKPGLFPVNACPDAALYGGWYALTDYRACCRFNRGAVAWHLASGEANTLRAGTKCWCPNLLAAGAAVTLGPVAEPYTVGFPKPAEFFGFLVTGEFTVGEVYAKTVLVASWRGVLVGDPLYNPYGKSKPGKVAAVTPSPRGAPAVFK